MGIQDIFTQVQSNLQFSTPMFFGKVKKAQALVPPRIVWIPSTETLLEPGLIAGSNPRALHVRRIFATAEVWGIDLPGTEALYAGFITALRISLLGRTYDVQRVTWHEPFESEQGFVVDVEFSMDLPMTEMSLPTSGTNVLPTPNTITTTTLTNAGGFYATGVSGDGVIEAGKPGAS